MPDHSWEGCWIEIPFICYRVVLTLSILILVLNDNWQCEIGHALEGKGSLKLFDFNENQDKTLLCIVIFDCVQFQRDFNFFNNAQFCCGYIFYPTEQIGVKAGHMADVH